MMLNVMLPFSGLLAVPSLSTLEGVKRYISKMGNAPSSVSPKQSVMLDWVSNEDGSHILTVAVGNKVTAARWTITI
jgi:hypothetical protein